MEYKYINRIDSPADLKKLRPEELPAVCAELRQFIIEALSKNPGHLASSLGAIELTVALHYVFDTPQDKLVWDVGHQAYAHKILTGRRDRFHTNRQFKGLSPFTNPKESEYDAFIAGHASNSISAALGLDIADRFAVRSSQSDYKTANAVGPASPVGHNVVAIIGDGAMTGGLAFEGLNNTSMDKNNLLIVLNDNNMAIDPLKGGFTQYLVDLTTSAGYNKWRWRLYQLAAKLHLVDERRRRALLRRNNNLKALVSKQASNIFTGLNIRYFGPTDGHDVEGLVRILSEIKNHRGPKVLHIITKKGKGYAPAENDQTVWHAPGEFDVASGERLQVTGDRLRVPPLWQEVFGETLLELAKENERIVGITPAMPSGCSMSIMQKELPDRVFDVGIAEGHAVTFSAGLAKAGMLPYCNIYSTFMQRAYDNIVHDVALQNLHVVLCIDRAGIVGNDGATHHGLLDLAYLRPIPNMQICAPRTGEDLREMMRLAEKLEGPVAIRYPRGRCPVDNDMRRGASNDAASQPNDGMMQYGKGVKLRDGKDLAVLTIGSIGNAAADAIEMAKGEWRMANGESRSASGVENAKNAISIAHYDLRWLKPLDEELLHEVGKRFKTVVTIEDGMIAGGMGSAVLEWMADHGYTPRIVRLGVDDQFVEHGSTKELYHMLKLDKEGICESLLQALEK
ncbi:MAG: 1-deoxy-D-xylulose-5-phosphate synthase [Paludibacteraceae bacterium]|nr:1-deoxy-D-xylulose-5-phosphate synthase [Paludibacteraceae bacterium]